MRLSRWGARNNPFYGIVVTNARQARDGKFLEKVGTYSPVAVAGTKHVEFNFDRVKHFLATGAQPSERVAWLLAKAGIIPQSPKHLHHRGCFDLADKTTWGVDVKDKHGNILHTCSVQNATENYPDLAKHLPKQYIKQKPDWTKVDFNTKSNMDIRLLQKMTGIY
jgi:small subunit ribosomal protein S16